MGTGFSIRIMTMKDYEAAIQLWMNTEGVGLSSADSANGIAFFLERNPGLSRCAYLGEALAGTILCGHDGRRGYIHHLAVAPFARRSGLGRMLVNDCMQSLQDMGIQKAHLFVFKENETAREFWEHIDWDERDELVIMSRSLEETESPDLLILDS